MKTIQVVAMFVALITSVTSSPSAEAVNWRDCIRPLTAGLGLIKGATLADYTDQIVVLRRPNPARPEQIVPQTVRVIRDDGKFLEIEALTGSNFQWQTVTVPRTSDQRLASADEIRKMDGLRKIAAALRAIPDFGSLPWLRWLPLVEKDHAEGSSRSSDRETEASDFITLAYEVPLRLPNLPAIQIPLIQQRRGIPVRIVSADLLGEAMRLEGLGWWQIVPLTEDFITHSQFVPDALAGLSSVYHYQPGAVPTGFIEFRTAFFGRALKRGMHVIQFAPESLLSPGDRWARVETEDYDAFEITAINNESITLSNPNGSVRFTRPEDFARFSRSSSRFGISASDAYLRKYLRPHPAPSAAGAARQFTSAQLVQRPYLSEFVTIRQELMATGLTADEVAHYAMVLVDLCNDRIALLPSLFFPRATVDHKAAFNKLMKSIYPGTAAQAQVTAATKAFSHDLLLCANQSQQTTRPKMSLER